MNAPEPRSVEERIESSKARGLCRVLELSLEETATALAHAAARDVARLMALTGLEQVVSATAKHSAAQRPRELLHVLDRVRRLMAASEASGSIAPFVAADEELQVLARGLAALSWGPAALAGDAPQQTVTIPEALGGRPADLAPARDAMLRASVAAAVRAACDWLSPDPLERVRVERHDDTLVLGVRVREPEHLEAAGEVIAEAGGSLGPSGRRDGTFDLRVPTHVARPTFLLVEQGVTGFALPWHAVLRLRMAAREEALEQAPILTLLDGPAKPGDERPAALVAHGLRRAWVFADRVVWRLAATPEAADMPPPVADADRFVRDADDRRWWILEPERLLRGVPAPDHSGEFATPVAASVVTERVEVPPAEPVAPAPRDSAPASPPPLRVMPSLADVHVLPPTREIVLPPEGLRPRPEPAPGPARPASPAGLRVLDAADVEAIEPEPGPVTDEAPPAESAGTTAPAPPAPPPAPAAAPRLSGRARRGRVRVTPPADETPAAAADAPPVASPAPEPPAPAVVEPVAQEPSAMPPAEAPPAVARPRAPERPRSAGARVLVAEDSIVASIFLQRLLTQRGFEVLAVERCADLMAAIAEPDWAAVFVDVRLPDSPAGRHLRAVAEHRSALAAPFAVVALTSDADDEALARIAGVADGLRKPFDAETLDQRLESLGFVAGSDA